MNKTPAHYTDLELFGMLSSHEKAEKAFAELYSRYSQKVYLYCRKVLGIETDARDVFQETWMKFHSAAVKGAVVGNVAGYLFRIARNLCLNRRRSTAAQMLDFDEVRHATHDQPYEQRELMSLLDQALDLLDAEYREAFVLHEMEGFPYDEISAITGDTVPALKNRVWRARKQIRSILAPFFEEMK